MKKKSSKKNKKVSSKKRTVSKKSDSEKTTNKNGKTSQKAESEAGDITTLILRDHKPIKELILILKDPDVGITKKRPAFSEFEKVLLSHAKAEEKSLYIYLKQLDDLRTEGLEGDTEHAVAEQLMKEINQSHDDDDTWMAKVKVLAEIIDHHVKEEENDVLKQVRKEFSSAERIEIGEIYSRKLNKYREKINQHNKLSESDDLRADYV